MALLEGLTLGSIGASLIAAWSDKSVNATVKKLRERLKQGKLPVNGDLEDAVVSSLQSALLVLHGQLAETLKDSASPATRFWLDHFKVAVLDSKKLASFDSDLFVEERDLHEFLSDGQASDLAPRFHDRLLNWARATITQEEAKLGEPELFESYVLEGWRNDGDREEDENPPITAFKAFCLAFHDILKEDTRTFRIFEAIELKEIRELIAENGGSLSLSAQEIGDAFAPIANELRQDIRKLTKLTQDSFDSLTGTIDVLSLLQMNFLSEVQHHHEMLNGGLSGIVALLSSQETLVRGQSESQEMLHEILGFIEKATASGQSARVPLESVCFLGAWTPLGAKFVGRTREFKEIKGQLKASRDQDNAFVIAQRTDRKVIHGTGGIGKTQLAIEIAHSLYVDGTFPIVLLISAANEETLRSEIQGLAGILNLPAADSDDLSSKESAVFARLAETKGKWLLIVDNVDHEDAQRAVYEQLMPRCREHGTVLVTSRLDTWKDDFETCELDVLGEEAAVELLVSKSSHFKQEECQPELLDLAKKLGCLAAALEITASYLDAEQITPGELLADWGEELDGLLKHEDANVNYSETLALVWQRSLDRCLAESQELFEMLCLLAPGEALEVDYLEKASEKLFPSNEESDSENDRRKHVRIRKLLRELDRYALIQREVEGLSVRPVIAEVTRYRLHSGPPTTLLDRRQRLVQWWLEILPASDDYHRWHEWSHLQNHLLSFLSVVESDTEIPAAFTTVGNNTGLYFNRRGSWQLAEPLMRRALKIDEASFGNEHPNVAIDLNNLAQLLKDTNRLEQAEPLMRRALKIDEASFGNEHPNVAIDLNNLAQLLKDTNRLEQAEPLMRRAVHIFAKFTQITGHRHPHLELVCRNYIQLRMAMGLSKEEAEAKLAEVVKGVGRDDAR